MFNNSQSEKTKENTLINPKSGANSTRRLMTPSIKNVNLSLGNPIQPQSKEKKMVPSTIKISSNLQQKENVNRFQSSAGILPQGNYFNSKSKRKFTEIQKEKEDAKKQISAIINEIDALYQGKLDREQFIQEFTEILKKENCLNFSRLIPVSLNTKGSCLIEHSKFYILYIRYKHFTHTDSTGLRNEFSLNDFIALMDNCLMYDQDDLNILYSFFLEVLAKFYPKEHIFIRLQKKDAQYMALNGISHLEDLNENHYKYILAKPESFLKFELEGNMRLKESSVTQPNSSKKRKINNNHSMREHLEKSPAFKKLLTTESKKIIGIADQEEVSEILEKKQNSSNSKMKEISLIENEKTDERINLVEINKSPVSVSISKQDSLNKKEEESIIERSHEDKNLNSPSLHIISENLSKNNPTSLQLQKEDNGENKSPVNVEGNEEPKHTESNINKEIVYSHSHAGSISVSKNKVEKTSTTSPMNIKLIEPFHNSSSNIKNETVSDISPVEDLRNSHDKMKSNMEIIFNSNSNLSSNTNFNFHQINNIQTTFNLSELNITSFSSTFMSTVPDKNLSSDAQILYQEIILRNKVDLEIEKNSIQLKAKLKKPSKKKIYKMESLEKFSLISEEKEVREKIESPVKNKKNSIQTRSKTQKSRSHLKIKKREEEEEEKNAEDIEDLKSDDEEEEDNSKKPKSNNKRSKNVKNKKKYQSDMKVERNSNISSDEKEKFEEKETNTKKKKNKKEETKEDVRRGRKSSIMENPREKSKKEKVKSVSSVSSKESENEEIQSHSKTRTKKKDKRDRKSKSTTRSKKR